MINLRIGILKNSNQDKAIIPLLFMRQIVLPAELPEKTEFREEIRRAPSRGIQLNKKDTKLALQNALRYVDKSLHETLIPEFLDELREFGRIYAHRFRPGNGKNDIRAKPVEQYQGILEARALQLMMDNNVAFDVALFPYELVTYGSNGRVCQNWMQFRLIKLYLQQMQEDQTLVIMSGHPLGLFKTHRNAPRVINSNALMVGMFDNGEDYNRAAALGVANYGQMTAGGWMYIGPQGIVHGTYITLLNAGRKFLGLDQNKDLSGKLYITSGLGGMSGAQAKAIEIAGGIGIIAEVDGSRIKTRYEQGWVSRQSASLDEIFDWVEQYRRSGDSISIAYHGNVVDIWQYVIDNEIHVDLGSDQTSCHDPYGGGYTPYTLDYDEAKIMIAERPEDFKEKVNESLIHQYHLIKQLVNRGMYFFDYGNSFMKSVYDAGGTDIAKDQDPKNGFIFPSYVEDIMGPICFDWGYGPFRWVCLSGDPKDLRLTDQTAMQCINPDRRSQDRDNYNWIHDAEHNDLVVGSQARILYADGQGRVKIALAFNKLVRDGKCGPIMLGRDHHDTGGTDSPFRETSNIKDGSNIMAEMATHSWGGNILRGMTLTVLSNGGGVGIGKAVNGGFGLVLDGSERVDGIIRSALDWDVMVGVGRRAWARNPHALEVTKEWNTTNLGDAQITLPNLVDPELIEKYLD